MLGIFSSFDFYHFNKYVVVIMVLIGIFLITKDVEHLFLCLFAIHMLLVRRRDLVSCLLEGKSSVKRQTAVKQAGTYWPQQKHTQGSEMRKGLA